MKIIGIIPSRYGSKRFKGKPLVDILGKTMIQRVYEQCKKSTKLNDVIVATDDSRIYNHVIDFGGKAIMTSEKHKTGTERCNEVAQKLKDKFDLIINIQGDEPYINPLQINDLIQLCKDSEIQIATLAKQINDVSIIKDKNTPKAIFDKGKNALNFYRDIDTISTKSSYYKHIGIYAYKKDVLNEICRLPESKNEIKENLEQLRWLDNNYTIKVGITNFETLSVDTPQDLEKIKDKIR